MYVRAYKRTRVRKFYELVTAHICYKNLEGTDITDFRTLGKCNKCNICPKRPGANFGQIIVKSRIALYCGIKIKM